MRIDDNKEALAMMKRALASLIREAYNKGYQNGMKSMMAEDEPNCSEKPNNYEPQTERCPHCGDGVITKGQTTCPLCGEPIEQTDCAWR